MSPTCYIVQSGLVAGISISILGAILAKLKFTTLDLGAYTGCLLTGQTKGKAPLIAGLAVHAVASAVLPFAYIFGFEFLHALPTVHNALIAAAVHTLISGSSFLVIDHLSSCVRKKQVKAVGFCAKNYGTHGIIAFVATHMCYGMIVMYLLTR